LKLGLGDAAPILCTIGVFSWDWKVAGHLICMEAVASLRKDFPRIKLLIAGDGAFRSYLETTVKNLGLQDNIIFLGNVDHVDEVLSMADIYVHMALNEGCPLAVVEAMRAGKPIVAARQGGIPEIIEDGVTGILVEPTPNALAASVVDLLLSEERRATLGRNAFSYAASNFTWEVIAQKYFTLYTKEGNFN